MKKILKYSFVVLLLAGLITSAYAFSGKGDGILKNEDITKLTYEQFKEKTSTCSGRMKDKFTEENFEKIQTMHEARMNEDWDTVMSIKEELGISRMGKRNCNGNCQMSERVRTCSCSN